jgi:hypothetical protein
MSPPLNAGIQGECPFDPPSNSTCLSRATGDDEQASALFGRRRSGNFLGEDLRRLAVSRELQGGTAWYGKNAKPGQLSEAEQFPDPPLAPSGRGRRVVETPEMLRNARSMDRGSS